MKVPVPLIIIILVLAGCRREPVAVPRRPAYPRIQAPDTARIAADGLPAPFSVSASAVMVSPRPGWLDVTYPAYGAVANITFTRGRGSELEEALANRLERMTLNAGGLPSERREWTNAAGFRILCLRTDRCATPWQFVAADSRMVVSGALRFHDPEAVMATDSIGPILDAMAADLTVALDSLR